MIWLSACVTNWAIVWSWFQNLGEPNLTIFLLKISCDLNVLSKEKKKKLKNYFWAKEKEHTLFKF